MRDISRHFGPEDQRFKLFGCFLNIRQSSPQAVFSGIRHCLSQWGYTLPANDHISRHINESRNKNKNNVNSMGWRLKIQVMFVLRRLIGFGVGIFGFGPTRPIRLTPGGAWFKVSLSGARIWIHTTLPQEFGQNGSFLLTMSHFKWETTGWRSF